MIELTFYRYCNFKSFILFRKMNVENKGVCVCVRACMCVFLCVRGIPLKHLFDEWHILGWDLCSCRFDK